MNPSKLASATLSPQVGSPDKVKKSVLQRFEFLLDCCLKAAMIFSGLGLAILMFAQVIMRYALDSPFAGIEEAAILMAVWTYFLGMGYATKQRAHIHGGIVTLVVSDPFKIEMIRFIGSVICAIAACIFGYYAAKYGLYMIEKGRMSLYLQWPKGLWSASMIFGFFMMAGYFLLHAAKDFRAMMLAAKDQSQALGHQSLINDKD
ncbi:TRAP transporter small permease [Moritella sp. Urea-trap-13]|uniref:TRAP transporter small permease n=1 Tax=Moritella sp. Urea-trap-13 TaxID=2058327 RepID=UPI000C3249DE|nr:TRAP transporter small permease [Moritella sp. Urea-trap-13]PKH04925.1 TRAP transporter small permease [Moritella sp. Urea-trap-13]